MKSARIFSYKYSSVIYFSVYTHNNLLIYKSFQKIRQYLILTIYCYTGVNAISSQTMGIYQNLKKNKFMYLNIQKGIDSLTFLKQQSIKKFNNLTIVKMRFYFSFLSLFFFFFFRLSKMKFHPNYIVLDSVQICDLFLQ